MTPSLDMREAKVAPEPTLEHASAGCSTVCAECAAAPECPGRPDVASFPASAVRPRRRVARIIALGVLVPVLGLVVVMARSPSALQQQTQSPIVGKPAPALSGATITGAHFSLASLRGQFVFVDFFASWCAACQESQPYLDAFVRDHAHPGGARLVGVIFGDTVGDVLRFLGPEVGKYPVLSDPTGTITLNWGVENPAEIYLVDPQGEVIAKIDGAVTSKGLDSLLTQARLAGA